MDLGFSQVTAGDVPWVDVVQMREIDRLATDEVGLTLLQMMENAGSRLASLTRRLLGGDVGRRRIAVLVGSGGNGGGVLAAARHLANAGATVSAHLAPRAQDLHDAATTQLHLAVAAEVRLREGEPDAELILDGLLGYGQSGAPRGRYAELIAATGGRRVVALDGPSGLELTTGTRHRPCVAAEVTLTLAAPKRGLDDHADVVGRLVVADIGIPAVVYRRAGVDAPAAFGRGPLVEIVDEGGSARDEEPP